MQIYTNGPVKIGSAILGGCTNIESRLGSQIRGEPTSGEIFARIVALYAGKPTAGFTTECLDQALAAAGAFGVSLGSSALTLYGSQRALGGRITSGNAHLSLTQNLGLLYPRSLTAGHQADATLSYEAMLASSDGATHPMTLATGVALPSVTSVTKWTLSSVELAGQTINQEVNVSIDFGLQVVGEAHSSRVLDEIVSIRSCMPRITVASSLPGNLLSFLGATGSFAIVLRNRLEGGVFGTNTLTFSGSDMSVQETPFQVAGLGTAQTAIQAHCLYDGTHDPITIVAA